ncbi:MAG: hypothetical protein AAF216_08465 [Pseudomonadota bacterium]
MLHWLLSSALLLSSFGLAIFANHRAGKPWDDLKPRVIPWRLVMILAVFVGFLSVVHMVNLAGVETGRENSPFGGF